jgi:hypothetical protein
MRFLYCLLASILFYFPTAVLLRRFMPESHELADLLTFPIEDSWLFLLCLVLIYAAVARARKKIGRMESAWKNEVSSGSD